MPSPALMNTRPRRALRLPAVGALALLLPACPPGGQTTETDSESDSETVSVTISDSDSDTGDPPLTDCERYVACYQAAIPDNDGMIPGKYGDDGSCWQGTAAEQAKCRDDCETGLLQYHIAFPDLEECALPPTDVTFTIGEALIEDTFDPFSPVTYRELADGDTVTVVLGGQGLLMFPIGMRGMNFETSPDPIDFDNPKMPIIDLTFDVDGFNIGAGGHFFRLANYPVYFKPIDGGALEHLYVTMIVPDELPFDQCPNLDGASAHLEITLWTYENPPVKQEINLKLAASSDDCGGGYDSGPTDTDSGGPTDTDTGPPPPDTDTSTGP